MRSTCESFRSRDVTRATVASTFRRASLVESSSSTPHVFRMASAIGHHTLASPYGRHGAFSTVALRSSYAIAASSTANRLLPTPASPNNRTSCARCRFSAASSIRRSSDISGSRPTSDARVCFGRCPGSAMTSSAVHASTGGWPRG